MGKSTSNNEKRKRKKDKLKHKERKDKKLLAKRECKRPEIVLNHAEGPGSVIDSKERGSKVTIKTRKPSKVVLDEAFGGGRIKKRGKRNKVTIEDKSSRSSSRSSRKTASSQEDADDSCDEETSDNTLLPEKPRKPEIRHTYASKGVVADFSESEMSHTIRAQNTNIISNEANDRGKLNFAKAKYNSDVEMGSDCNYTGFSAVGGSIDARGAKIVSTITVTQGSSTSASTGIPNSTETTSTESNGGSRNGTPGQKIRVTLKSIAKKLTKHGAEFGADEKVCNKIKDIKKMLGEEGEIHLFHGTTEIDKSKSFRDNGITTDSIIVVKTEVVCTTGASGKKAQRTA